MSGFIIKEVIDVVVNFLPLSYGKIFGNISNCSYHGWFNGAVIEEEGADDLLEVDYL